MSLKNEGSFDSDDSDLYEEFSKPNTQTDNKPGEKFTSFGDLGVMMKRMGKLVGSVTTDLNKSLGKMGDIFSKFGESLSDSDKLELQKLFITLTEEDKELLLKLVNDNNSEKLREWFGERCDNEKLVDTIASSTEVFKEAMEMGSNLTKEVSGVFGDIFPEEGDKIGSMLGGLMSNFENNFGFTFGAVSETKSGESETTEEVPEKSEEEKSETIENIENAEEKSETTETTENAENIEEKSETKEENPEKKSEESDIMNRLGKMFGENLGLFTSDIGEFKVEMCKMKDVMNKAFNPSETTEDEINTETDDVSSNIYTSIVGSLKGLIDEDDKNAYHEITDTIDNMVGTIEETFTELNNEPNENNHEKILTDSVSKFLDLDDKQKEQMLGTVQALHEFEKIGEKIQDSLNDNIRQGLINDTADMIAKHKKLSDDIDNVAKVLNPIEIKILELKCGGELPLDFRLRMMENKLSNLDTKLTKSIDNNSESEQVDENAEQFDELNEKIDDISLNLDLLLTKLSRFIK